ncbi:MAG: FHA domain-containing protein, partial [Oscillibacter sp.]|nr:FHA domain-containing protein [Oscillibacter sp.]
MKETRLRLILLSDREYTSLTLPEKCAGSYWIRGRAADGRLGDLVSVEAQMENGQPRWTLKSNRLFQIEHKSVPAGAVALAPDVRYGITASDATAKYTLYVEPLSDDRRRFQAYLVTGAQATFVVAREAGGSFPGENARIRYASQFVSQPHAYLTYRGERFEIREREGGSTNHTYVNGKAIGTEPRELRNGDLIYIMGLRIITVGRYLFMNNPEGKLSLSGTGLTVCRDVPRPGAPPDDLDEEFREETKFYYRAPRFRSDAETLELHLDPPPSNPTRNEMPMALAIGPSVTMGLSSAASAMFAIVNAAGSGDLPSAFPTVVMSGSMLLGSMFWPVLTRTYQRNQRRLQEEKRQVSYDKYLQQMGRYIEAKQREQEQILRENSDNARTLYARILARPPKIWERTRRHADFLSIVLGYGQLPARIKLDCQGRTFSIEEDNLFEKMYSLGERHYWLNDVPITLSLLERYVAGVCGERENLVPYATNLI